MFKSLTGLGSILKQAQQISGQMQNLADELKSKKATGTAAAGLIEVEINGAMEVLKVSIDEALAAKGDRELLEDLLLTAVNDAIGKAKSLHAESLQSMTSDFQLPGLGDMLGKMTGGPVDLEMPESSAGEDETAAPSEDEEKNEL